MTHRLRQLAVAPLAFAIISACGQLQEPVSVRDARANATPAGATVGAVYLELTAAEQDTLMAATTSVADRIEMHTSSEENGMMRMRPLPSVELKPGESFRFAPGGAHFMLLGLHQPLIKGTRFPLTLQLQNAGTLTVQVEVKEPGSH